MPKRRIGNDAVDKIDLKKNGKIVVTFHEAKKVEMSANVFTDHAFYVGKQVSATEMNDILDSVSFDKLMNYALRLCSKTAYSEHDVRAKLKDHGAEIEEVRKIMAKLKAVGFIDDVRYANCYAEEMADLRLYGKNRVISKLEEHGVPYHIIQSLEFPLDKEIERATNYAKTLNKKLSKTPSKAKKHKAINQLMTRGFEHSVAVEAVNVLTPNDPDEERKRLEKAYIACRAKYSRKFDGYELNRRIYAYLLSKGYKYEDIQALTKEDFE